MMQRLVRCSRHSGTNGYRPGLGKVCTYEAIPAGDDAMHLRVEQFRKDELRSRGYDVTELQDDGQTRTLHISLIVHGSNATPALRAQEGQ